MEFLTVKSLSKFFTLLNIFWACQSIKIDTKVISHAISDIVNNLGESYSMRFEIIIASDDKYVDIIGRNIMRKSKSSVNIRYCTEYDKRYTIYLTTPTIILMNEDVWDKFDVIGNVIPVGNGSGNVKRLLNTYYDKAWIIFSTGNERNVFFRQLFAHCFQIFPSSIERNSYVLVNFVFHTTESCDPNWKEVNEFSTKSMTWKTKKILHSYDKFFNCSIGLAVPPPLLGGAKVFSEIFDYKMIKNGQKNFGGIYGEMLIVFAKKYQANFVDPKEIRRHDIMILTLTDIVPQAYSISYITPPICFVYSTFDITKGYTYTPLQKLILPFDDVTWILLITSFMVAFALIFLIYRFPIVVQDEIFGKGVYYPTLGLFKIFFGLDYVRLPEGNFARIIFMTFTIFCIIIRTGYQGKMFDFLVTDVGHSMPKTVKDLLDSGIYIFGDHNGNIDIVEM